MSSFLKLLIRFRLQGSINTPTSFGPPAVMVSPSVSCQSHKQHRQSLSALPRLGKLCSFSMQVKLPVAVLSC